MLGMENEGRIMNVSEGEVERSEPRKVDYSRDSQVVPRGSEFRSIW